MNSQLKTFRDITRTTVVFGLYVVRVYYGRQCVTDLADIGLELEFRAIFLKRWLLCSVHLLSEYEFFSGVNPSYLSCLEQKIKKKFDIFLYI